MDMDKVIKQILEGGLTPQLMLDLMIVFLAILLVLWLKDWVNKFLAKQKFKGSMDISKDVIVRELTATGYTDFRLESVDIRSIILRSIDGKLKKIVPTHTANDRDWITVQRQDESDLVRAMDRAAKASNLLDTLEEDK